MPAEFLRAGIEKHGGLGAFQRRQRIVTVTRTFENITPGLDDTLDIAGLTRRSCQTLKLIVEGF